MFVDAIGMIEHTLTLETIDHLDFGTIAPGQTAMDTATVEIISNMALCIAMPDHVDLLNGRHRLVADLMADFHDGRRSYPLSDNNGAGAYRRGEGNQLNTHQLIRLSNAKQVPGTLTINGILEDPVGKPAGFYQGALIVTVMTP